MSRSLKKNLAASVFSHLLRYGMPLTIYPLLTRTLGTDGFAHFSLMMAMALILSQFIEFGFGLMSVREIAQSTEEERPFVVGEIMVGRLITLGLSGGVFLAMLPILPLPDMMRLDVAAAVLALATAYGFSPSWYYIAVERASRLAIQDIVVAAATLGLVFFLVRRPTDSVTAVAAFAGPLWVGVIVGHVEAVRDLGFRMPSAARMWRSMRTSTDFFILTGVNSVINRTSVLFLGALSSPAQVAYYAAGEKLVSAAINATQPFLRVLTPRISNLVRHEPQAAGRLFKKSTILVVVAFTVAGAIAMAAAPWGVPWFFGAALAGAVPVFIIQLLLLPASAAARTIGVLGLIPLRQERIYRRLTLAFGLVGVIALPAAAYWGGGIWVAAVRVAAEAGLAIGCLIVIRRLFRENGAAPTSSAEG